MRQSLFTSHWLNVPSGEGMLSCTPLVRVLALTAANSSSPAPVVRPRRAAASCCCSPRTLHSASRGGLSALQALHGPHYGVRLLLL